MRQEQRGLALALIGLIVIGTLAGLLAAYQRFHVEAANRRVEIALEWAEVSSLAQWDPLRQPISQILAQFKAQGVRTIIFNEDTVASLEQTGELQPLRVFAGTGNASTYVSVNSPQALERIRAALMARGLLDPSETKRVAPRQFYSLVRPGQTVFSLQGDDKGKVDEHSVFTSVEYANLRSLGLGLPPEAVQTARAAGMRIAGRISNFPGVSPQSAANVLQNLHNQGATTVIFSGDDVLGYRGLEKDVANLLLTRYAPSAPSESPMVYGAVEFGKQKGDEKLTAALHGEYVRVHSIQAAEMGQIDETEAIDRFARAARERNIRFCYVRLLTFAGSDPVGENVQYLKKVTRYIERNSTITGGHIEFDAARPFAETGVSPLLFALVGLSVAAGTVAMLRAFCPLPNRLESIALVVLCIACAGLALGGGEIGRKLVALLGGIAFPALACLLTFPQEATAVHREDNSPGACLAFALRGLVKASAVTLLGIIAVIGLLATRPFLLHASQFVGIKAQHAIPLLIVALAALLGGVAAPAETWPRFRHRAMERLRAFWNEPARFGLLIVGLIALAVLALVVARTGNDPGVGVSGIELKARSVLDRVLPVRPRTKEFLIGHPAFVLGLAWWLRGRRRLALPAFVLGSLGQVSLLNTFCHIHTPLLVSLWRDSIGLVVGALFGAILFLLGERWFPPPKPLDFETGLEPGR